jgi:uncharacterized protein YbjT (DUF2867 family)
MTGVMAAELRPLSGPVTVFGGTGFLGRAIVRHLAEEDVTVRVAARNPQRLELDGTSGRIEHCEVDVREDAAVAAALRGAEAAINAVGLYIEHGDDTFEAIHVHGAERIAHLAREAHLRGLVHVSGIGVSSRSESAYVRARARGEMAVRAAFPAVILRPSVLFGPGDTFLSTMRAISRLPAIPLFGDGATQLQPVHVDDVAAAAVNALQRPSAAGRVFELGGPKAYSYREIVQTVLERTGRRGRLLLSVPFGAWQGLAAAASMLPRPPLTRDQVLLMQTDNVVGNGFPTFADLGIEPRSLESVLGARS